MLSYMDSTHFSESLIYPTVLGLIIIWVIRVNNISLYLDSFPVVIVMNHSMKILTTSWVDKEWVFDSQDWLHITTILASLTSQV